MMADWVSYAALGLSALSISITAYNLYVSGPVVWVTVKEVHAEGLTEGHDFLDFKVICGGRKAITVESIQLMVAHKPTVYRFKDDAILHGPALPFRIDDGSSQRWFVDVTMGVEFFDKKYYEGPRVWKWPESYHIMVRLGNGRIIKPMILEHPTYYDEIDISNPPWD